MASSVPNRSDIEVVFTRLRSLPTNKVCFDCNSKNPTWASITYGVFICIDCSAVHRGLGVHLTFVRSTQLDINWTWLQLRQMQLGGNVNAMQFFTQHNCVTSDAQKKYNSRAAQLYREKLQQTALSSLKNNPDKIYIQPVNENVVEEKEIDFFEEHEKNIFNKSEHIQTITTNVVEKAVVSNNEDSVQLNVHLDPVPNPQERKSIIGARKTQPKKTGLATKKGGLGATKVKTNFADIEREAELADEARSQTAIDLQKTIVEEEKQVASVRLAYKDLGLQQKKHEDKLKKTDPKKAEQMERLGMGFASRGGVSHSVLSDMQTIEQENLQLHTSSLSKLGRMNDTDSLFDDFSSFPSSSFNMNRTSSGYGGSFGNKSNDLLFVDPPREWTVEPVVEKIKPLPRSGDKLVISKEPESDLAQKKFASAKAISSDQFFDNKIDDYEIKANLNRFQGSSSISSSELFGNDKETNHQSHFHPPDVDDIRESVRQGVTKVAGKLSSLASGVMSSIQDRYGY